MLLPTSPNLAITFKEAIIKKIVLNVNMNLVGNMLSVFTYFGWQLYPFSVFYALLLVAF